MKNLAPDIFRQRLLIEGYYKIKVSEEIIKTFFEKITFELGLRTYAPPRNSLCRWHGKRN